jgi:hypothetical protein
MAARRPASSDKLALVGRPTSISKGTIASAAPSAIAAATSRSARNSSTDRGRGVPPRRLSRPRPRAALPQLHSGELRPSYRLPMYIPEDRAQRRRKRRPDRPPTQRSAPSLTPSSDEPASRLRNRSRDANRQDPVARYDHAAGLRRMLEDFVISALPNNPTLSFQSRNNGAPVCIESRLRHERLRLCAIICAFSRVVSITRARKRQPHRARTYPPCSNAS